MRVELVIVDLDGPVLDVRARYGALHEALVRELGLPATSDPVALWEMKRRRAPLAEVCGVGEGSAARALVERYAAAWRERIEEDRLLGLDRLQPGAGEALAALPVGVRRVLVSLRTNRAGAAATLERLGLVAFFDTIELVPHASGGKHDAFRRLGSACAPAGVIAIGDTEVDLEAAAVCGYEAIAVACGIRTAEVLRALGARTVVADLRAAVAHVRTRLAGRAAAP